MANKQTIANPLVSILMAVYNGEAYLTEALNDLLRQTLNNFELIVVNDGSTDGTAAIIENFAAHDARVLVLTNTGNLGLTASLNRGLIECRAPLVARSDADDRYKKNRLARQVAFITEHPRIGLLSCGYHIINAEGEVLKTVVPPIKDEYIRIRYLFMNSLLHPGIIFRTDLVRQVGGYDERYWTAQDSDLWARLLPITRVANLPDPLVYYRVHADSIMKKRGSQGRALSLSVPQRLLSDYLGRPLSLKKTRTMVEMFQKSKRIKIENALVGMHGLREVLKRAYECEMPDTVRYLKREIVKSILNQIDRHAGTDYFKRWVLLLQALQWEPRFVLSGNRFIRAAYGILGQSLLRFENKRR